MPRGVYVQSDLLQSRAFLAIRSAHSIRVLFEFYRRRKISKPRGRQGKDGKLVIVNNGEIVLPYRYAKERLGIPQTTFSRCLSELVALGFLDVAELSDGLHRQPTKWTVSDRWRLFGKPDFVSVERERRTPYFAREKKISVTTYGIKNDEQLP